MIGTTVSHYKIIRKLGRGGMGEVYLAEDKKLKRNIAIKLLPMQLASDTESRERFKREAMALTALSHPNIITVYEVAQHEHFPYIILEYLEGHSFKEFMASGNVSMETLLDVAMQISDGLCAAHAANIVHRDIKSDNILITSGPRAKILDFGLAKWKGATKVTGVGSTLGTLAYMSPEQARGEELDFRSDLFSLGIIFYEATSHKLPFGGAHETAIAYSLLHEEPEPLSSHMPNVSEDWQRIISKCLRKRIDERYQSAADLRADLKSLQLKLR
jgi:serine/threonine protein kinase